MAVRTWTDVNFKALSPLPPCGQGLWFWLLFGQGTINIPGIVIGPPGVMAGLLHWPANDLERCLQEIESLQMIMVDRIAGLTWLPNGPRYNKPESPNVVRSWGKTWPEVPECPLKVHIWQYLKGFTKGLGEAYLEAYLATVDDPSIKGVGQSELPFPESGTGTGTGTGVCNRQDPEKTETHTSISLNEKPPADWTREQFDDRIVPVYPPKRRPPKCLPEALQIFRELCEGRDPSEVAKLIVDYIIKCESSKDWRDGVIPNLDRFMRELPASIHNPDEISKTTRRRPTEDTRPPVEMRCPGCDGRGCEKCNQSGLDQSKVVSSKRMRELTPNWLKPPKPKEK